MTFVYVHKSKVCVEQIEHNEQQLTQLSIYSYIKLNGIVFCGSRVPVV
jgi:hypothetical protein